MSILKIVAQSSHAYYPSNTILNVGPRWVTMRGLYKTHEEAVNAVAGMMKDEDDRDDAIVVEKDSLGNWVVRGLTNTDRLSTKR